MTNDNPDLKINNFDLLGIYLKDCGKLTETLLAKALKNKLTSQDGYIAKEVSQVANIMCAIYFFREDKDFNSVLRKMPPSSCKVMTDSIFAIWGHLVRLDEYELAQLAIETIQKSSYLADQLNVY